MKLSIWTKWVAPAAIPLAMAANLLRPPPEEDIEAEVRSLKAVMPGAQLFSEKAGSPPCYRAYGPLEQEPLGLCFTTKDVVPHIVGYAGPLKLMVGMDTSGVITGVAILAHNETPSYVARIYEPWFTRQFKGKPLSDPFELGKDVDGITRATVTVEAIASSIREGARKVGKDVLGLQIPGAPSAKGVSWTDLMLLAGVLGFATVGFLTRRRAFRWVTLLLAVAILGFLKNSFLSAVSLSNSLLLRFPPLRSSLLWWVLLGVAGLTSALFGRFYCGWLCPFGAIEEFVGKFKRPKLVLSTPGDRSARTLKYWILWFILILSLVMASSRLASYEPFATVFGLSGGLVSWALVAVVFVGALVIFRFWCRYFCPVGAVLALVSRVSVFKLKAREKCRGCRVCGDVCPVKAISRREELVRVNPAECIQCNECLVACPSGILARGR